MTRFEGVVMKAIFIGGSGLISSAVSQLAIQKGWELTLVNRGKRPEHTPKEAEVFVCDANDYDSLKKFLDGKRFDVAAQWIGFAPERVKNDIELFQGKVGQYIFISSCAAYERPMKRHIVTEDLPLNNRYWEYGRQKRRCEEILTQAYRESEFPATIARPSLTYGNTQIPYAMGCWDKPWSLVQRILDGKPIICHGDGTSLWSVTHNEDFAKGFVGLMGRSQAIGEAYNIASDEILTWDQIALEIGEAVGVRPKIVHMSADQIARFIPEKLGDLLGDKSSSCIIDCSKLKRLVPSFCCEIPFSQGIRRTISYFRSHPELQEANLDWDRSMDELVEADSLVRPRS
jgi:nucleoside-diphosphate-sugar epimerase